jgi:phage-related protein
MISSVTSVPTINSYPVMEDINEIELLKKTIDKKLTDLYPYLLSLGIIDILIRIIKSLISFVQDLINLILQIFNLLELIEYLIELIISLYEKILSLINSIIDIFNPNILKG